MLSLKIKLQNCYGIKKFESEFDFSDDCRIASIYAPNGVMKTSFAKTFKDLSNNVESKDIIFPERITLRDIKKEDGSDLTSDEVFVIEPYNQDFSSGKMSTLLVNKALKERYDQIHLKIDEEKEKFLKDLKTITQFKGNIEREISLTYTSREDEFFLSINRLEREVMDGKPPEFADIVYNELFNDKVHEFLKTPEFKERIDDYISKYEELISKSKYFKKGVFNHTNASTIAKSLVDNGFFEASHFLSLHAASGNSEIKTEEELKKVIEEEKESIINSPELKKAFDAIDKKLSANAELRRFRDYLAQNIRILPELKGLNSFRQKLWVSYFKTYSSSYMSLVTEYRAGETELNDILNKARSEITNWVKVIEIFNKRFSVPFQLRVENQSDVILQQQVPNIVFDFKDSTIQTNVSKDSLMQVLSTGEKRALYILNIIFEIEARKEANQETLFIVDDVADSFDYKNKYAIIQYLKDISDDLRFTQIILTHNFDFYRTLASRFVARKHCFMVERTASEVKLVEADYIHNPFKFWMEHLQDNPVQLIASIPFTRNLIEYTKGDADPDYLILTSLLHIKADTKTISVSELERIYNSTFPNRGLTFANGTDSVYSLMTGLADTCLLANESINLENKIVLSIIIRLLAEDFMLTKLTNKTYPPSNQTRALVSRYKDEFGTKTDQQSNIGILDQVNLMTPENIHLNSFMYEPILDMSDEHLKNLYKLVKTLD